MSVDTTEVKKMARLSRVHIQEEQLEIYQSDMNKILDFMDLLNTLDTDSVEPMAGVGDMTQRLREDEITDGGYPEKLMKNAPESTMHFFIVPKVVE